MNRVRIADVFGLATVSGSAIYGAVLTSGDAIMLAGLTILFYACVVLFPGFGAKIWVVIFVPIMVLSTIFFVIHVMEWWLSVIVAAGTIRVVILMVTNTRRFGAVKIDTPTQ